MTKQIIKIGEINGKSGDSLYAAFTKVNANFDELYTKTTYSSISGSLIPSEDVTYDLGSPTKQWRHLYVSENTIYVGGQALTVSQDGDVIVNGEVIATPGGGATWNSVVGKPNFAAIATSGSYNDLSDTPSVITNADVGTLGPGDTFFTQTADTVSMGNAAAQNITAGPSGIQIAGTGGVTIMGVATATVTLGGQTSGNIIFASGTSGIDYGDLSNTPNIPSDVSDLTDNTNLLGGGTANLGVLKISGSTIGTQDDPNTGGWGSYSLNLDPGGESWSYIQIPSVPGQTVGGQLVIANNNVGNGGIRLSVQGGDVTLTDQGLELVTLPVKQNNSWTRVTTPVVDIGPGTVVWTSNVDYISSAKLPIQVEASEVGDTSGWHSQACEAIISCRGYAGGFAGPGGDPQMIVYGVVHTSVDPLVTFTVQRNLTTKMVEVVGTLTAAANGAADLRIHSVELSTRD